MSPEIDHKTPVEHVKTTPQTKPVEPSGRLSKLKLAFLYVLIGGLAASALIAIVALLVGSFNSEIQKSLLTIFVFFSHSLLILGLLWADKKNEVGRAVLPTSIFVLTLANMITTTLATWEIISNETAWRALGLYFLIIGAVFIITGILKLRIKHRATSLGIYITVGAIAAFVIALVPWVLQVFSTFDPFYYRVIAALSIFSSTAFIIAMIVRGIALNRHSELATTKPAFKPIPVGLLTIYIIVGTVASMVWCAGLGGFIVSGVESSQPAHDRSYNKYY
jgi:hypothetical protein